MVSPSYRLLPTEPQKVTKVSIGSQLPGSWLMATLSVPAAWAVDRTAGSAPPSARARAVAVKVLRRESMFNSRDGKSAGPTCRKRKVQAARATRWPGANSTRGMIAGSSPTRRTGLGISPSISEVSMWRPGSATGTAANSLRV